MSRIGKLPIKVPSTVDVRCNNLDITVKGKFGTLKNTLPNLLEIKQMENTLIVSPKEQTNEARSLHGLYRTLVNNMVIGVSEQFQIDLILKGVGYRAVVQGKLLVLNLGYSHQVEMEIPEGITVEVKQNVNLNFKGCDKEQLGQFAAKVRSWRTPEPYKGKGILYQGEVVKRKAGKSGKK
jgi:large subunit ribosomal protein L6